MGSWGFGEVGSRRVDAEEEAGLDEGLGLGGVSWVSMVGFMLLAMGFWSVGGLAVVAGMSGVLLAGGVACVVVVGPGCLCSLEVGGAVVSGW